MENIHSEVYTDAINTFVPNKKKRRELFQSIDKSYAIKQKAEWAKMWLASDRPFSERLVAFAAIEGILFSASFCAIFYFRSRGVRLPGLYQSNEYISRDEALHCQFACLIHSQLLPHNQCSKDKMTEIIRSAVATEEAFVNEALSSSILGMNAPLMMQYVRFVADVTLKMLGCEKTYGDTNPFPFMETISIGNKTNFFERKVTEYSLASVAVPGQDKTESSSDVGEECDFNMAHDF